MRVAGRAIARLNIGTPSHIRPRRAGVMPLTRTAVAAPTTRAARVSNPWSRVAPTIRIRQLTAFALGSMRETRDSDGRSPAISRASASPRLASARLTVLRFL